MFFTPQSTDICTICREFDVVKYAVFRFSDKKSSLKHQSLNWKKKTIGNNQSCWLYKKIIAEVYDHVYDDNDDGDDGDDVFGDDDIYDDENIDDSENTNDATGWNLTQTFYPAYNPEMIRHLMDGFLPNISYWYSDSDISNIAGNLS